MSEAQKGTGRGSPPGTPRWLKLFVVILLVVVVLLVILHFMGLGFGGHGIVEYPRFTSYILEQR